MRDIIGEMAGNATSERTNRYGTLLLVARDVLVAVVAVAAAFLLRFDFRVPANYCPAVMPTAIGVAILFPLVFSATGIYRYIWRYVGIESFLRLARATVLAVAAFSVAVRLLEHWSGAQPVPYSVVLLTGVIGYVGFVSARSADRFSAYALSRRFPGEYKRVLIIGAGDAGSLLMSDIETNPHLGFRIVGFLDDDPDKLGRYMRSVPVLGRVDEVCEVVAQQKVDVVFVAVPSADATALRGILYRCGSMKLPVRFVPALALQRHSVSIADLENVDFEGFLGRESAALDMESVRSSMEGQTILVTGASGSIGSELCRQVLAMRPSRLVLLEIDESRLYETFLELRETASSTKVEMALADIRNAEKVHRIFARTKPDLVIHAAAYKHVPLMEMEPDEAVKTNIGGTLNILEASRANDVARFLLISTDKAVRPTSVMGLTKAIAERLTFEAGCLGMHVTAVRFGNVLGSRGSVIPLFHQRLDRGEPVQVTHPDADRFFMTIPEAARLVLQAQSMSDGCDLYVLDMGEPVKIVDLAAAVIQQHGGHAEVRFSGLRPAEKLHEELIHSGDRLLPTICEKVMRSDHFPTCKEGVSHRVPDLLEAAEHDDREGMQRLFLEICPDFAGAVAELSGVC